MTHSHVSSQALDFRTLFESVPGLYLVLAPDLKIVAVSDAYLKATMTERDKILGCDIFDVFPDNPDDPTATGVGNLRVSLKRVLDEKAANTMAVQKYDIRRPASGGGGFEERYWSPVNSPVLEKDTGKILYIVHRVEDVTEFVKLKERGAEQNTEIFMRAQAELFLILETANDAFISMNAQGRITGWNRRAETLFGWSQDEIMGRALSETIIPPAYRDMHQKGLQRFLATGEGPVLNKRIEITALNRQGHEFPVELSISSAKFADTYTFNAFIHDITERKRMEEQLLQNEERFRLIVHGVKDYAIFMLDPGGNVATWNVGAEAIKGYRAEEIVGKHFSVFYPEEDVASGKPARELEAVLKEGRFEDEGWRVRKDGTKFWANVIITALKDAAGDLRGFANVSRDMTERKRAETELKKAYSELERSNRELEQFAYVASHDLQEPLRMVASYCQLLEQRYKNKLDDDATEFIAFAVDGAKRMQGLINDLLIYSRVSIQAENFIPTGCEKVFEKVVSNLGFAIEKSSAVVTHDALPVVMGDAAQLSHLFQNLISNAVKFCKADPPRVHVGVVEKDNEWLFFVQDNGIGIDAQFYDRIFVMFQRLHTREAYSGTGIGLAICKKVVEFHGGRIWVESRAGYGSTFYFTIPNKGGRP